MQVISKPKQPCRYCGKMVDPRGLGTHELHCKRKRKRKPRVSRKHSTALMDRIAESVRNSVKLNYCPNCGIDLQCFHVVEV